MTIKESWFDDERICLYSDEFSGITYCENPNSCRYKGERVTLPQLDMESHLCEIDGTISKEKLAKLTEF